MSIFDSNSLLSQINRNETEVVDEHIAYNINLARRFSEISRGAYDITIKPLTDAWGFGRERSKGEDINVDSLLEFVGYEKLTLEGDRLIKSDARIQLDLNSIAKGYVVDMVAERLRYQKSVLTVSALLQLTEYKKVRSYFGERTFFS